jgi:hypothetical protein
MHALFANYIKEIIETKMETKRKAKCEFSEAYFMKVNQI